MNNNEIIQENLGLDFFAKKVQNKDELTIAIKKKNNMKDYKFVSISIKELFYALSGREDYKE